MTNSQNMHSPSPSELITAFSHQSADFLASITKASSRLDAKLNQANTHIETLDAELLDAQTKLMDVCKDRDHLAALLKDAESQLKAATHSVTKIKKEAQVLKTDLDLALQRQAQLEEEHGKTNDLLFQATDGLACKEKDVQDLTSALGEAADRIHDWENQALEWSTSAEDWVKERLALQDKCTLLQSKADDLDMEVSVLREETSRQSDFIQELEAVIKQADNIEFQHDQAIHKLAETESVLAEKITHQTVLESKNSDLESKLADRDRYIKQADHELSILQQAKDDIEAELILVTNTSADIDVERSRLESKCNDLELQSRLHCETIEILTNQVDEEKNAHQAVLNELIAKNTEVSALKSKLDQSSPSSKTIATHIPTSKGPSSVVSTASHLYDTMAKYGIKRKSPMQKPALSVLHQSSTTTEKRQRVCGRTGVSRVGNMLLNKTSDRPPLAPGDSVSVVGMCPPSEFRPASRPSLSGVRKSIMVTFSGFRESLPEYRVSTKGELVKIVEQLNGGVQNANDEFDMTITHVVTPPNSRTFKTLAAALCHRWLIFDVNWVLDSGKAGKFLSPDNYGKRYFSAPFNGKKICITDQFRDESKPRPFRIDNAIRLIETYGKGIITSDSGQSDIVLTAISDTREYSATRLDWIGFIKLIMPHENYTRGGVRDSSS